MYIHTPRTLRVGYSYPLSLSEMEQFIKTVDLHSLSEYMKYTFGIDANLTIKIDHDLHDFWISIYSDDNLTSQCGIMSNSLKNVRFKSTQSSLFKKLISFRNENDTTFADPILWVTKQECNDIYPRAGKAVGMDFGLKHFLNLDDGTVIDSPQWYKASLKDLQIAHRTVSRCQKGSQNRRRAIRHLERVYQRISNRRRDWFFKLANQLVGEYAIICIEDLNLDGMKRLWGRKVSDLAFAEFVSILEWVASNAGSTVVKIDRWVPSSKACHVCGTVNPNLTLKQRRWECDCCHTVLDRDTNAAINIKRLGLAQLGYSV